MVLICWTVYSKEGMVKRYINTIHPRLGQDNENQMNIEEHLHSETKIIVLQALGYVVASMLCQIFPILHILSKELGRNEIYQYLHVVFRPLQGLFNLMIFMGHKVCNIRRSNNELTRWQACCQVLLQSSLEEPTLFLSNINIVREHETVAANGDDNMVDISFPIANTSINEENNNKSILTSELGPSSVGISYNSKSYNDISTNVSCLSFNDQKGSDFMNPNHDSSILDDNHKTKSIT